MMDKTVCYRGRITALAYGYVEPQIKILSESAEHKVTL